MGRWRYAVAGILARTPCRRCRVMRASCGTPHSHPSTLVYNTIIFATRWSHPTHEPTPTDSLITSTLVYSSSRSVQLCAYHYRRRSGTTSPRMRVLLPPSSRTPSIALIQILFTNTQQFDKLKGCCGITRVGDRKITTVIPQSGVRTPYLWLPAAEDNFLFARRISTKFSGLPPRVKIARYSKSRRN